MQLWVPCPLFTGHVPTDHLCSLPVGWWRAKLDAVVYVWSIKCQVNRNNHFVLFSGYTPVHSTGTLLTQIQHFQLVSPTSGYSVPHEVLSIYPFWISWTSCRVIPLSCLDLSEMQPCPWAYWLLSRFGILQLQISDKDIKQDRSQNRARRNSL